MKNIFYFFIILLMIVVGSSCDRDEPLVETTVSVEININYDDLVDSVTTEKDTINW